MITNPSVRFQYIRFSLIGIALLVAVSVAVAYADAWHERYEAKRFLEVLSTIKVGSSTENDVLNATKSFSCYEDSLGKPSQRYGLTGVAYTFRNRVMAFLHLAPPKFLYVAIDFRDGVVIEKSVNFYQEPRFGVVVQEAMASEGEGSANISARQLRTNVYGPNLIVIEVHDDTSVPLSRRQLDWQIDLSCMTMMIRCRNPQRMLPGIFPAGGAGLKFP